MADQPNSMGLTGQSHTRTEIVSVPPLQGHDLEAHLECLRALDKLRRRSAYLRNDGYKALKKLIEDTVTPGEDPFKFCRHKDVDIIDYVMAIRVYRQLANNNSDENYATQRLEDIKSHATLSYIKSHDNYSVHLATEVMGALISEPKFVLSRPVYFCWYLIIRELYMAAHPDWCVGGARSAINGGEVNPYSTAQCVRVILDFADRLETTAKCSKAIERIETQINYQSETTIPSLWRKVDEDRLAHASRTTLQVLSKGLALSITPPPQHSEMLHYVTDDLPSCIADAITNAEKDIKDAISDIGAFRTSEAPKSDVPQSGETDEERLKRRYRDHSESAHKIALFIITTMEKRIKDAKLALGKNEWGNLAKVLDEGARRVREGLNPTRHYLLAIIDHHLVAAYSRGARKVDPAELAWASDVYAALEDGNRRDNDCQHSLRDTVLCLDEHMAHDGTFPAGRPFHVSSRNVTTSVSNTITLSAFADLVRRLHYPLNEAAFASKMLNYLEETRVEQPADGGKTLGWSSRHSLRPHHAELDRTAEAVQSLATINRMYDDGINDIIFDHFSVKQPDELLKVVNLDQLFYPDYGFGLDNLQGVGRESVATTLQKMRRHITGFLADKDDEKLHSLVLYGPAGTGKTTLVESLALTCNVPLVEVTPSDIAKSGEVAIERNARTVFETLSLLTRVVIVFDEFDPVLRRRDTSTQHPSSTLSFLSFLTPGMLPKLKTLNEKAKDRHVAYALITNLIGMLDESAVRDGRFNSKVGIYPPDPLSRYGRLAALCQYNSIKKDTKLPSSDKFEARLSEVVKNTGGLGMTALTRDGWFVLKNRESNGSFPIERLLDKPIGYLLRETVTKLDKDKWPEPEEIFKEIKGQGKTAELEYVQWGWLNEWEKSDHFLTWPGGGTSQQAISKLKSDVEKTRAKTTGRHSYGDSSDR